MAAPSKRATREEVVELEEELQEVRELFNAYRVQATRKIQALQAENAALRAVSGELAAEKELEDLKAKHKEELRAAKHAAWNAACHEIRAAALVVGSKDHKYVLDAMGEFE
jgi:hypothetical protein